MSCRYELGADEAEKALTEAAEAAVSGGRADAGAVLCAAAYAPVEKLAEIAAAVTSKCASRRFEMCSIINAKSGACPEDCKWCAQSARHGANAPVFGFVGAEECVKRAAACAARGVSRFSIVTSGRKPSPKDLAEIARAAAQVRERTGIRVCASLGLLSAGELAMLRDAGVDRYHCNVETAPSFFANVCGTHTFEDKLRTLEAVHEAGLELCSGGIFGMGESLRQRVEMAEVLRSQRVCSVPLNILCPIPGTPMEHFEPMPGSEFVRTVAAFRLMMPSVRLRFAAGQAAMSGEVRAAALKCGVNSAIVGDMLTTPGSVFDRDVMNFRAAGYLL